MQELNIFETEEVNGAGLWHNAFHLAGLVIGALAGHSGDSMLPDNDFAPY
ncbi:hypothetical protein [Chromobacterium sp. IIBBL 290-4]|nr:hypothetical protein [Chromobacterium sp. IIBBL 290-4]UTH73541.1 hypothetical protein NKT35_18670 [Chromobacterium sp. IIBBL 290-4]